MYVEKLPTVNFWKSRQFYYQPVDSMIYEVQYSSITKSCCCCCCCCWLPSFLIKLTPFFFIIYWSWYVLVLVRCWHWHYFHNNQLKLVFHTLTFSVFPQLHTIIITLSDIVCPSPFVLVFIVCVFLLHLCAHVCVWERERVEEAAAHSVLAFYTIIASLSEVISVRCSKCILFYSLFQQQTATGQEKKARC